MRAFPFSRCELSDGRAPVVGAAFGRGPRRLTSCRVTAAVTRPVGGDASVDPRERPPPPPRAKTQVDSHMSPTRRLELDLRSPWAATIRPGDLVRALGEDASLRHVQALDILLTGMEPGVALAETVRAALEELPSLTSLTLRPLRLPPSPDGSLVTDLSARSVARDIRLVVDARLDPDADAFAVLADRDTSLARTLRASRALRDSGIDVRWTIPLIRPLIFRLEALFSLARDEGFDPVLEAVWRAPDGEQRLEDALEPDEILFAWDFITYRVLGEERHLLTPAGAAFYEELGRSLEDHERPAPYVPEPVTVLRPLEREGVFSWERSLERRRAVPPTTVHQAASEPGAARLLRRARDLLEVLVEGSRALLEWALARVGRPGRESSESGALGRVLVIGAYGGEHIGDTAILGGVLQRVHRRYGTTRAILMSQRARHTRHLVPMLETPVTITVEDYRQRAVSRLLDDVDGVVFAGGPLMDIPKQLVKHLYTVARACRHGKPFIAEGIGAGPFLRMPSAWAGRRLVAMAERISVRTSEDAKKPLVRGLDPEVGQDPAFDYLHERPGRLTRLRPGDERWLRRLLDGTEDRVTVAINVRPITPLYTVGVSTRDRVEYTRSVESEFERRLAEGLVRYGEGITPDPCFIFYPMNAIQFGKSDLRSAYRIVRRLGAGVEFRVWEDDASLDGVVALLRRVDIVIAMRFHAAIFGLSQSKPVVGIDYRIGRRDKVAALLADRDREDRCRRVDQLTADWLHRTLAEITVSRLSEVG